MRSLEFDPNAFEDLAWWVAQDRNKALRLIKLIREVQRDPSLEQVSLSRCGMN